MLCACQSWHHSRHSLIMQTFLPYPNFAESAKILDYRRLGKQRVETKQIIMTLSGDSLGWRSHPAVKMWRGYELCLRIYGMHMCNEWRVRGYNDSLFDWFSDYHPGNGCVIRKPPWLGDPEFHASHRSNLLRKDPTFYGKYGWDEPSNLSYVWPTK